MMRQGMRLVLASRSRARLELMRSAGYRVTVCAADIEESRTGVSLPFADRLRRLAERKAAAVAARFPDAWTIGADTALELDGAWIGKAPDAAAAQDLLTTLSGRRHRVGSAVCVISPQSGPYGRRRVTQSAVDVAWVTMRRWSESRIRAHIRHTRPFTCAGAYALQGGVGSPAMISRVEGDPSTVIGLPIPLLDRLLETAWEKPVVD